MVIEQRTLSKAIELYEILGEYIPPMIIGDDSSDFLRQIINNIKEKNPSAYFDSIQLMEGIERETLLQSDPADVFEAFVRDLVEWDIVNLVEFFKHLGYKHGR